VGPRTVLDAVVKRKIPSPRRKSNPRTPISLVAIPTELSRPIHTQTRARVCVYVYISSLDRDAINETHLNMLRDSGGEEGGTVNE
jgi:hypothetical protein